MSICIFDHDSREAPATASHFSAHYGEAAATEVWNGLYGKQPQTLSHPGQQQQEAMEHQQQQAMEEQPQQLQGQQQFQVQEQQQEQQYPPQDLNQAQQQQQQRDLQQAVQGGQQQDNVLPAIGTHQNAATDAVEGIGVNQGVQGLGFDLGKGLYSYLSFFGVIQDIGGPACWLCGSS